MSCFGITDTKGQARCTLADSHPHGPSSEQEHEEHEGPLVVTLAGTVDRERIQLPAVVVQDEGARRKTASYPPTVALRP